MPASAILALGFCWCFYVIQNYADGGEPFAWLDGISAWPSIAIILFAAFLSLHFIFKTHVDLKQNAGTLAEEFFDDADNTISKKTTFFGWETTPSKPANTGPSTFSPELEAKTEERVDIEALWQVYLCRGRFRTRAMRAALMTLLYIAALIAALLAMRPMIGNFPRPPIRGVFPFHFLIFFTICAFLFLTFFVIDAILLHEGFLIQLAKRETCWPDATFQRFKYSITPNRPLSESDLADYWDILLISKRTEALSIMPRVSTRKAQFWISFDMRYVFIRYATAQNRSNHLAERSSDQDI